MRVRIISFGTNWWAAHSNDLSDPMWPEVRPALASLLGIPRPDSIQPHQRVAS
jgi:hypothetical protein